jgi:hypothetical protein
MTETYSTKSLQSMLTYPFKDPKWAGKFFTAAGLTFASSILPLIPALFVNGYMYRIMHNVIVHKEDPSLPEWTDWGELLRDGWRLFAVTFLYQLPMLTVWAAGFGFYMVTFISIMASDTNSANEPDIFLTFIPMGIFMISMIVASLLGILTFCALPAAMGHTVAHDSFNAGFDFTGWWQVMKANRGGFAATLLILVGLISVMYLVANLFYMTIVLMCLMFVIPMVGMVYIELVGAAMVGVAYREGKVKLEVAQNAEGA